MAIHKCNQEPRLTKLETVLDLTNKMAMEKFDNMEKKIDNNHVEIKEMILDMKANFVLRSEFKVALSVVWALATTIWVIMFFINNI